jgi:ribosomal protein S18 acetylase RimI-like enzyme
VEIRRARADDVAALQAIVERAYAPYVERIGRRPAPMDDDYTARVRDGLVDVIHEDGEILGLIVLVSDGDSLLVENVVVHPSHQGLGVGRALLAHADDTAGLLGLAELRLYTNAAMTENLGLYRRLGYREIDRRTEDGFQRVFFSKPSPLPTDDGAGDRT